MLKWNNADGPPTEKGWDSYGGLPTTQEAIKAAERIAEDMQAGKFVAVPTSNGGVSLESFQAIGWEIEIGPDGEQVLDE